MFDMTNEQALSTAWETGGNGETHVSKTNGMKNLKHVGKHIKRTHSVNIN